MGDLKNTLPMAYWSTNPLLGTRYGAPIQGPEQEGLSQRQVPN